MSKKDDKKIQELTKDCNHIIGLRSWDGKGGGSPDYKPVQLAYIDGKMGTIDKIGTRYAYCPRCGIELSSIFEYLENRDGRKYVFRFADLLSEYPPKGIAHMTKLEDWYGMYLDNKYKILEAFIGTSLHRKKTILFKCEENGEIVEIRRLLSDEVKIYSIKRENSSW